MESGGVNSHVNGKNFYLPLNISTVATTPASSVEQSPQHQQRVNNNFFYDAPLGAELTPSPSYPVSDYGFFVRYQGCQNRIFIQNYCTCFLLGLEKNFESTIGDAFFRFFSHKNSLFGDFSETARAILTKLCMCFLMTIGYSAIPNLCPRYPWGVRDMAPKRVNLTSFLHFFGFSRFLKNCSYDFAETHTITSPGQYLSAGTKYVSLAALGGWELSLKIRIFDLFGLFPIFSKTARTIGLKSLPTPTLFES